MISLLRGGVMFTVLAWLNSEPETILAIWIALTSAVALIFPIYRPYATIRNNIRWFGCEALNIVIYALAYRVRVLGKSADDFNYIDSMKVGSMMLTTNTVLYLWNLLWTIIELAITVYEAVKDALAQAKIKKQQGKEEKDAKVEGPTAGSAEKYELLSMGENVALSDANIGKSEPDLDMLDVKFIIGTEFLPEEEGSVGNKILLYSPKNKKVITGPAPGFDIANML